jgi:uncharacterized protein (DUF1800 family)
MGEGAAARLLMQGTFGPTLADIDAAAKLSYDQWFADQAVQFPADIFPQIDMPRPGIESANWQQFFFKNAVQGTAQLRQRMAFALSQIMVVSGQGPSGGQAGLASYYDMLAKNSLGNFRDLLERVALHPAMGLYLSHLKNSKADPATGVRADENFAREIMQLFSIGLVMLNADGTEQKLAGVVVPTYGQSEVANLAKVFTGWSYYDSWPYGEKNAWDFRSPELLESANDEAGWRQKYTVQMMPYPSYHDRTEKKIVGLVGCPSGVCSQVTVPAGGTAESDLKIALDTLFNHPNVGPFISKQLIQRLVTSNPSPAYVSRVAAVFNNNGKGVRGDLLAVAKAILTDTEATSPGQGKLREPVLRITQLWRAFQARSDNGASFEQIWEIRNPKDVFAQMPLYSPSVFNFYRPDYTPPANINPQSLVMPEFQITSEATVVTAANEIRRLAYQFKDSTGAKHRSATGQFPSSDTVTLSTANWEGFAADPANLVEKLNLVFMSGQMSPEVKSLLVDYAGTVPIAEPWLRVIETTELLVNSPQYLIQR